MSTDRVILVDARDRPVGAADKLDVHRWGLLHRAFSVLVLNPRGELLLQRRARTKYHSGGLWSNTCCSHPSPGEETLEAAHRRLREEMGFDCPLRPVGAVRYRLEVGRDLLEHEYDHVLVGRWAGAPDPDPAEVEAWVWVDPRRLRRALDREPERFTPWFPIVLAGLPPRVHREPGGSLEIRGGVLLPDVPGRPNDPGPAGENQRVSA
jgi:isopentenyl-diphosphate delta-isomerase